jgi:periplasmic copper chaperone A
VHSRIALLAALFASSTAVAHPSIASGPAFANKSQKITMGLSHGCDGADTLAITIDIPAGVTSVRPLFSDFGKPSVTKDSSGNVTSVTWRKTDADLQSADIQFYEFTLRARIPDVGFTRQQWITHQTCRDANGVETLVHWDQPPGSTTGEPAPMLTVVPARLPGWNKVVLGANTTIAAVDLPTFFGDALIVWRGNSAFSSNPNTMTLIQGTAGVSVLATDLAPNDEIWVKY